MSGLDGSAIALGATTTQSLYGVTGSSVKIGIISVSYDANGGAGANVALGDLPSNVTVVNDEPVGSDEGQAMTELAYQIAPGATYYFAAAGESVDSAADAVNALVAEGCNIIVDDVSYDDSESMYQIGSTLDQAIESAVAWGVDYFSAAGNDGNSGTGYFQASFTPIDVNISGIGQVVANDFGGGSPYLSVTIPEDSTLTESMLLQWAQPFASYGDSSSGAANSLGIYLLDDQGNVVASSADDHVGSNPVQGLEFVNDTDSTSFRIVVAQNGGTVPAGQVFTLDNANSAIAFDSTLAAGGSGNLIGHELLADTNVVAAADYASAPSLGGTPTMAYYSSYGPGTLHYDADGNPLATPITLDLPSFTSVAGSATTVPGFGEFSGTSAAAPNAAAVAALMLQANPNLSTTEITALLEQSAIPVLDTTGAGAATNDGAGLIQARAAVELANAAGGIIRSDPTNGNWAMASGWSGGQLPNDSTAIMLSDDFGVITDSYTVTVNTGDNAAGSLTLSSPLSMSVTLAIVENGELAVGGSSAANITAGDFLVAAGGNLLVSQGTLTVSGSLNSNDGNIDIQQGIANASNFVQNSGTLTVGGSLSNATFSVIDDAGVSETGGTIVIGNGGTLDANEAIASVAAISVLQNGTFSLATAAVLQNASLAVAGQFDAGSLTVQNASTVTVIAGGTISTSSMTLTDTSDVTIPSVLVDGSLSIGGNLGGGGTASSTVEIGSKGIVNVGGAATTVSFAFDQGDGLLNFSSNLPAILLGSLSAEISGFGEGAGTIEFGAITYDPLEDYGFDYNATNGELDIEEGDDAIAAVELATDLTYNDFAFSAGTNGALTVTEVACFVLGTGITSEAGSVKVEALRVGDRVCVKGGVADIVWVGSRKVNCKAHPNPEAVWPVQIAAHSFGKGKPCRDLFLSPDHALYLEGVLIPVKYLIDGNLIQQAPCESVTYFHIELQNHSVIFAENLAVESYLDVSDRGNFNHGSTTSLHPTWGAERLDPALLIESIGFAPLRVTGAELDIARSKLRERAHLAASCKAA